VSRDVPRALLGEAAKDENEENLTNKAQPSDLSRRKQELFAPSLFFSTLEK
jgi:hypothetical protein